MAIRKTEAVAADNFNQIRMQIVNAAGRTNFLAFFDEESIHLSFGVGHYFFDAGGGDAAVANKNFQSATGNFPAQGIKRREANGVAFFDFYFYSGETLKCGNVAAALANNTAFNRIVRKSKSRYGVFGHIVGGTVEHGVDNNILSQFGGF